MNPVYYLLDNEEALIAVALIVFFSSIGQFAKRKNQTTILLLQDYDINDSTNGDYMLKISGVVSGFLPWLLDKLKLKNRNFVFYYKNDQIDTISGDKNFEKYPTRDLYSIFVGYKDNKSLLLMSIVFALLTLSNLYMFLKYTEATILIPALFFGGLCYLFYWLYMRSSMMSIQIKLINLAVSVHLKSSLTGKKISMEDLIKIKEILYNSADKTSRFYNGYYKK